MKNFILGASLLLNVMTVVYFYELLNNDSEEIQDFLSAKNARETPITYKDIPKGSQDPQFEKNAEQIDDKYNQIIELLFTDEGEDNGLQ